MWIEIVLRSLRLEGTAPYTEQLSVRNKLQENDNKGIDKISFFIIILLKSGQTDISSTTIKTYCRHINGPNCSGDSLRGAPIDSIHNGRSSCDITH